MLVTMRQFPGCEEPGHEDKHKNTFTLLPASSLCIQVLAGHVSVLPVIPVSSCSNGNVYFLCHESFKKLSSKATDLFLKETATVFFVVILQSHVDAMIRTKRSTLMFPLLE